MKWISFDHTPLDSTHYCQSERHQGQWIPANSVCLIYSHVGGKMTIHDIWYTCHACRDRMSRDVRKPRR